MRKHIAWLVSLVFYASMLPWANAEYFNYRAHNVTSDNGVLSGFDGVYDNTVYNIKDPRFGAVGDGATDDTAAINAAIAAVKAQVGGTILVPAGRYLINSTITIDYMPTLIFQGIDGRIISKSTLADSLKNSTFVNGTGGTMFVIQKTVTTGLVVTSNVTFDSIGFDNNGDNNAIAVDMQGGYDKVRFYHCGFLGGKYAVTSSGSEGTFNAKWEDCDFHDVSDTAVYLPYGVSRDYLNMVWEDCVFRSNGRAVDAGSGNSFYFYNTLIESSTNGGVRLDNVYHAYFIGAHFEQNGPGYDIEVNGTGVSPKVLSLYGSTFTRHSAGSQVVQVYVTNTGESSFIDTQFNGSGGTASVSYNTVGGKKVTFIGGYQDSGKSIVGATEYKRILYDNNVTYSAPWTSGSNPQPDIGNGTINSTYTRVGELMNVRIHVTFGSTTTFGTGTWYFGLPVYPTDNNYSIGNATMIDNGVADYLGRTKSEPSDVRLSIMQDNTSIVSATIPFTWGDGDELILQATYGLP